MVSVYMAQGIEQEFICYPDYWLDKDMENMGYIFEYCDKYCKELYNKNIRINKEKFLTNFMKSDLRKLMEIGHPQLISQAAIDTIEDFIEVDNEGSIEEYLTTKTEKNYKHMQMYWIGWMYAYIHFRSKERSRIIVEKLPIKEMIIDYRCGHEVSKENYYDKIKYLFE